MLGAAVRVDMSAGGVPGASALHDVEIRPYRLQDAVALADAVREARAQRPPVVSSRPYRLQDAVALADAVRESVAELQPWMPWSHADYSVEESRSWLELQ